MKIKCYSFDLSFLFRAHPRCLPGCLELVFKSHQLFVGKRRARSSRLSEWVRCRTVTWLAFGFFGRFFTSRLVPNTCLVRWGRSTSFPRPRCCRVGPMVSFAVGGGGGGGGRRLPLHIHRIGSTCQRNGQSGRRRLRAVGCGRRASTVLITIDQESTVLSVFVCMLIMISRCTAVWQTFGRGGRGKWTRFDSRKQDFAGKRICFRFLFDFFTRLFRIAFKLAIEKVTLFHWWVSVQDGPFVVWMKGVGNAVGDDGGGRCRRDQRWSVPMVSIDVFAAFCMRCGMTGVNGHGRTFISREMCGGCS